MCLSLDLPRFPPPKVHRAAARVRSLPSARGHSRSAVVNGSKLSLSPSLVSPTPTLILTYSGRGRPNRSLHGGDRRVSSDADTEPCHPCRRRARRGRCDSCSVSEWGCMHMYMQCASCDRGDRRARSRSRATYSGGGRRARRALNRTVTYTASRESAQCFCIQLRHRPHNSLPSWR